MSTLAWHFLRDNRCLQFPPYTLVEAGGTYTAEGPLVPCKNGMHGSLQALDALAYAPGSVVCRVLLAGERVDSIDKVCAHRRTVLWLADAAPVLHEFACLLAEQALLRTAAPEYRPDPRLTAALVTKRAWLRQERSVAALLAAHHAARDAAWAVSRETSSSVARAAAGDAASEAARADPQAAARGAVQALERSAAWWAVRDVDSNVTWVSAWSAAQAQAEATLVRLLYALGQATTPPAVAAG